MQICGGRQGDGPTGGHRVADLRADLGWQIKGQSKKACVFIVFTGGLFSVESQSCYQVSFGSFSDRACCMILLQVASDNSNQEHACSTDNDSCYHSAKYVVADFSFSLYLFMGYVYKKNICFLA